MRFELNSKLGQRRSKDNIDDVVARTVELFDVHRNPQWLDRYTKWAASQKNYHDAVVAVCSCKDGEGHHCRNQSRIAKRVCQELEAQLLSDEKLISKFIEFEQLNSLIESYHIKGSGAVMNYFTALRLAAYLKILPKEIYLSGGSRKGLAFLYSTEIDETQIKVPRDVVIKFVPKFKDWEAQVLEDFLCIVHQFAKRGTAILTSLE